MPGSLRVAYLMRVDALDKPGGDVEHMRTFLRYCRGAADRRGMSFHAEILTDLTPDLTGFDVVHLTNLDRPVDLYAQFRAAMQAKRPMVITPLHHSYREIRRYERLGRGGWIGRVSGMLGFYSLEALRIAVKSRRYPQLRRALAGALRRGLRQAQTEVLRGCRFVLVTTEKERRDICTEIAPLRDEQVVLLRHGVEHESEASQERSAPERDIEIAVIARLESRKNQIAILNAVESLGERALLVGPPNPNHAAYVEALRARVAASRSTCIPGVPPEDVPELLSRARVHVAASWFEVSSLVDLEAYLRGCRVVASRCGGTEELLGEDAYYVDPGSAEEIRAKIAEAVASARAGKRNDIAGLRGRLATWDEVADLLLDRYLEACTPSRSVPRSSH